jgi:hypothetical protein
MARRVHLLVLLAVLLPFPSFAQSTTASQKEIYRLTDASSFEDGCFAPCLCPAHFQGALIGAFTMTPDAPTPLYRVFKITDLNWFVPNLGYWVTGSGTYKVGGEVALTHELSLDLVVGDRDVQHYDSGVVPGGADFPAIKITISMNNMVCHDTVFGVSALPVPQTEIRPYVLGSSYYEEGCFGPCECAITAKRLTGGFGLLKLGGADSAADFAVVNVQWLVRDPRSSTPKTATGTPVAGAGLYHVDAATHAQRMRLALLENGAGPTRFDSGAAPWKGSLGRIDVDVAESGFACHDTVYSINAGGRGATAH